MRSKTKVRLYVAFRQSILAVTLATGVITGCFFLFTTLPGDPARIRLGPDATVEAVERLRVEMGLDRPLIYRLGEYIGHAFRLDFGKSWMNNRQVSGQVCEKMGVTLTIGVLGSGIALFGSYLLNLVCYLRPKLRWFIQVSKIGIVSPSFFIGVFVAILLGVWLPMFSLSSKDMGLYLLVAAIASLYPFALMTQVLVSKIEETDSQMFGQAGHAFGFSKFEVFHKILLPSSAVSWLAVWVNHLSVLLMSGLVLEVIFSIEGLGPMLVTAIERKDLPILQGILLLNAFLFILIFWVSEITYRWIDPRIKQSTSPEMTHG